MRGLGKNDAVGLLRPSNDAHSLGIAQAATLLAECGVRAVVGDEGLRAAAAEPLAEANGRELEAWIRGSGLTALGFSYRLDPADAVEGLARLVAFLRSRSLLAEDGGPLRALFFAGLPDACDEAERRFPGLLACFRGGEDAGESLEVFGIPRSMLGTGFASVMAYDDGRLAFGKELVESERWKEVAPVDRSGSPVYGRPGDGLVARIDHGTQAGLPPLFRAHAGPYLPDRREAVELFIDWTRRLARGGLLDVLSIGTSQLTQERFGEDWGGAPNGGGVPIDSAAEYRAVKEAAGGMLVRTYAGTRRVDELAEMHEDALDIAWHAFSLWWFSALDGRGPNGLLDNLREHRSAIARAAARGKPVEPNVPHHFAFRGADDVTYVASGWIAARFMRDAGAHDLVLQVMLNTPRATAGIQDLAKGRALLRLSRELEDGGFRVHLQPRAGLDYLPRDAEKAKARLAASTALMDDIEPHFSASPPIIHVVSYSEACGLAGPETIEDSIRICRRALDEYRSLKREGKAGLGAAERDVEERAAALERDARRVVAGIEASIEDPWTPQGLHDAFAAGFLPVPDLANLREEYPEAVRWRTALFDGGVRTVNGEGVPESIDERLGAAMDAARRIRMGRRNGRREADR